ncbi:MAG: ACP S-malonyltransferase [Ekhidna sp.]|nr:ACP S-malonyltransferase [Ekhidna sp.]MBC6409424.1 ACP S-malonyltransferase [Ekhidna sp.]MBC6426383.1 ACP S-malonyltransferase [Ekhidna sp.]
MKRAYVFPGQGAQFSGMAKELYQKHLKVREMIDVANDILGFDIKSIMFSGSDEELKETKVTQPAIFIHSVAAALTSDNFSPDMVAGHSLGEFSALVANGTLSYEDGLGLVSKRALAMQKACELEQSTMAAVLGLEDQEVEDVSKEIEGVVVAANYNCPGQLVISGELKAVETACERLKERGARRALILPVGGAFHSPLMESAQKELAGAIRDTPFGAPSCPVYQNVDARAYIDVNVIKENLILQLTSPVRWSECVRNIIRDGATEFIECGPGKVLQGLVKKIDRKIIVSSIS